MTLRIRKRFPQLNSKNPVLRPALTLGAAAMCMTLSLLPAATLQAQSAVEGPLVLRLPSSARVLGMGNAGLSSNDADVVLYNPGMLISARGVAVSLQRYGSEATAGSLATVTTVGSLTVGVAGQMLHWQSPTANYADALRFGATHLSDGASGRTPVHAGSSAFTLGAARTVKGLRVGAAVKYAEDRVGANTDGVAAFDVGASRAFGPAMLSVVAQNLGLGPSINGTKAALPRRIGVGWGGGPMSLWEHWDLGMQAQLTVEGDDWFVRPAGGVELGYVPIEGVSITFRNGLRLPRERDEPLVTAGLGVTIDRFSFDYAMEPMRGGRPVSHRVGIRLK
ncbi:MAG TPA: hypothetical protein VGE27_01850 [Gemmatimonas sp.]|uniref:hypothetical protein n=1 Tax=Gemmatimonas sp. TaxID=1962908 RepID=UPI002ED79A1A